MADASPRAHPPITYHLLPRETWEQLDRRAPYRPGSLAREGFIHCTDGEAELMATANRYYRSDPRPYVALALDRARIAAPVRYDDPAQMYPHVYGPLNLDAVLEARAVCRAADGAFQRLGAAGGPSSGKDLT